jgi:cytochrome c biogenesis protein CcmG/thiol:disulfide interchange protein DsbE
VKGRGPLIALVVAAVVVVSAAVAVAVTRNSDDAGPQTFPVAVTGTPLPQFPKSGTDTAVGRTIPTLTGRSLFDGSPLTIKSTGRKLLVVMLAHWCPHCRKEVPVLVQWLASNQKPAALVMAVSTGVSKSLPNYPPSQWLKDAHWPAPVLADSSGDDAASAYGLVYFPYLVLVGPDGKVLARTTGELTVDQLNAFVAT